MLCHWNVRVERHCHRSVYGSCCCHLVSQVCCGSVAHACGHRCPRNCTWKTHVGTTQFLHYDFSRTVHFWPSLSSTSCFTATRCVLFHAGRTISAKILLLALRTPVINALNHRSDAWHFVIFYGCVSWTGNRTPIPGDCAPAVNYQ